jgi:phage terminase small subunit
VEHLPTPADAVGEHEADPLSPDNVETPSERVRNAEGLTARQAAFVDALLANGGRKREAAETAGYAPGPGAGVAATRALRIARVQEAILRRVRAERVEAALPAMATMRRLLKSKSHYVQLEAATRILDGAMGEVKGSTVAALKIEIDLG